MFFSILYTLFTYLRKHKDEALTSKHTLKLALLWIGIKCYLIPAQYIDFYFHHQWKMIVHHLPHDQIYKKLCFGFNYTPLFSLL